PAFFGPYTALPVQGAFPADRVARGTPGGGAADGRSQRVGGCGSHRSPAPAATPARVRTAASRRRSSVTDMVLMVRAAVSCVCHLTSGIGSTGPSPEAGRNTRYHRP